MSAFGTVIVIGTTPTLLFEVVDGITYLANGYTRAANPEIFLAGDVNAPLPIVLALPSASTIYLGGSTVTTGTGAPFTGISALTFNVVGDDSLYGVVSTGTTNVSLLVMKQ